MQQSFDRYFLSYFPLQTFPVGEKFQILESDDVKTQMKKWLYKTSLDVYDPEMVRSREATDADLQIATALSGFKLSDAEEKNAREYLGELKLNYDIIRGLSKERILQILTTGYLKPLHRFEDYSEDFVKTMVNLRSMEQHSKTPESLKYAQSFSSSPEKLRVYLENPDPVIREWRYLSQPKSDLERLPPVLISRLMKNLSPTTIAGFKSVSKTTSRAKVIKWKAVIEGGIIKDALEGYILKQISHLTIKGPVIDLEYLRNLTCLESLELGWIFDQQIRVNDLPDGLTKLIYKLNQPIGAGVLPKGLKIIEFGLDFNQPIGVDVLPEGLRILKFGSLFNQPIQEKVFPDNLESLEFGINFDQPIGVGVLPKNLRVLKFGGRFDQLIGVGVLPIYLESLEFGNLFNRALGPGIFPQRLKNLVFGNFFNKPIAKRAFQNNIPIVIKFLPNSIESLTFGRNFNQPNLKGSLPKSLKSLTYGTNYNQSIKRGYLPDSLKILKFGPYYNRWMESGSLPKGLEVFMLGKYRMQPTQEGNFPFKLKNL